MNEVPVMISTKDLSYLEDMFDWNFIIAKLANKFSKEVFNEEIRNFMDETYLIHKSICNELIDILNNGGNNEYNENM